MTEREQRITEIRQAQPMHELRRKALKARCKSYWTQEEVDYFLDRAKCWSDLFNGEQATIKQEIL